MARRIKVFYGSDHQEADTVCKLLVGLGDVELEEVCVRSFLDGKVLLPFIQTTDGGRYYGVDSIRRFAEGMEVSP